MQVTMADVARAAGVNQATVSRALGSGKGVSASRQAAIRRLAEQMGYRPDPLVRALMVQRRGKSDRYRGTIGVLSLWPQGEPSWWDLEYYDRYRLGVSERIEENGYGMDILRCDASPHEVRGVLRTCKARGIQGMVITQAHESITQLPFRVEGMAAAYIGSGIQSPHLTRALPMLEENMRLAWRKVREAGHERIAFVTWKVLTAKNHGAWLGVYRQCQQELPARARLEPFESPAMTLAAVEKWLLKQRPDAVISENSGLLLQIRAKHPALPCFTLDRARDAPFAGINVRRREIGASAADAVIAQLARGERGLPSVAKRIMIEGVWEEGD